MRRALSWTLALLLAVPGSLVSPAWSAQAVVLAYANTGLYADSPTPESWLLRVDGAYVTAADSTGTLRWSISPSGRTAQDCEGITHLALDLRDDDGDGRINAMKDERARLVVTSSWHQDGGWDSAVLVLDVGRPETPRTLWRKDSSNIGQLARLVAEPVVARLGATTASSRQILIGAGLPTPATTTHGARTGAALLALDLETGMTAPIGTTARLTAGMSGAITALDLDRNGRTDRLYVGDAQATLWRFDVDDSAAPTASLAGGPLARLGSASAPDARSIIAAPDVALLSAPDSGLWFNIAVGTTYTGAGLSPVGQGLYVVRDTQAFERLTQARFDALPVATPENLLGGYSVGTGSDGIVARAMTASGVLLYTQVAGDALSRCSSPGTLIVKASAVQADSGSPVNDAKDGSAMTGRVLRRQDGSMPSPLDAPTLLPADGGYRCGIGDLPFDACPQIPRIRRRAWRREDAD